MILLCMIAGFGLIGAGTWRQSAIIFGEVPSAPVRHALLAGGYGLLGLSLVMVLAGGDMARALVEWVGWLTVGAGAVLLGCWMRQRQ